MARKISGKLLVTAPLEAKTAIYIGGAGGGDSVDLELAMDGRGRTYIPGTSLAGVMRAWFERQCPNVLHAIMGFQDKDNGQASHLIVEDAVLSGGIREIRDGVGIDSATGTAAENLKFTRAVLPRGVGFMLNLEVDLPTKEEEAREVKKAMRGFLEHLNTNGLRLGAAKTRGLGKVGLQSGSEIKTQVYSFPDDLDAWLDGTQEPGPFDSMLTDPFTDRDDALHIEIKWKPVSPVMVKSGAEGGIADMLPLVSGIQDGELAPVIPGSSVKGVLRSRAALILRTVLQVDLPEDAHNDARKWKDLTLVSDLFGSTLAGGRLFVDDTYQTSNAVNAEKWLAEDEATMNEATVHADHVAIDRFTGGASDSALFSDRTPRRDKAWEAIRIEVDFGRKVVTPPKDGREPKKRDLTKTEMDAQKALLALLLRDLKDGWVPIGFGSRRGMGEIAVESITINGDSLDAFLSKEELQAAWDELIEKEFERSHAEEKVASNG